MEVTIDNFGLWIALLWIFATISLIWWVYDAQECGSEMGYRDEHGICVYE